MLVCIRHDDNGSPVSVYHTLTTWSDARRFVFGVIDSLRAINHVDIDDEQDSILVHVGQGTDGKCLYTLEYKMATIM